ncbi:MAG: ribosome-associated toxin RatA of RatAB toxin-antitoxin module [Candidatus Azotimanducaceae bacterium]|jgi:ribosome-associated toxin RatA of RatAB toxin-antitoxin module
MFDVVNNVARYSEYLPWCDSSRIISESEFEMVASISLKATGIRQSFTTRNTLDQPNRISMAHMEGLFSSLHGEWYFKALGEDGCRVSLDLNFDVPRTLAAVGAGRVFDHAADKMVDVFCVRASELYGS